MTTPEEPQPLTLIEAVIPVASLIVLVGLSFYLFGDAGAAGPNQVALVFATMIAAFIACRRGSLREADQHIAIVLRGRILRSTFPGRSQHSVVLFHTVGAAATLTWKPVGPGLPGFAAGSYVAGSHILLLHCGNPMLAGACPCTPKIFHQPIPERDKNQRKGAGEDHATDHHGPDGLTAGCSGAGSEYQGKHAHDKRHRSHNDRAEALPGR